MDLDDKIKQALNKDAAQIELLMNQEKNPFKQLFATFKGNRGYWNIFGMLLSIITAVAMCWCGYYFFTSTHADDLIFWGFITLALWTGTLGFKIWFWLEINRNSASREVKRLEIAIAQLTAKLTQD